MASIPESRPFRGPWIIAGCFLTFGVASGFPYYNISFFFDYFRTDHGWTQQAITLGAPIAVLLTIWAGPVIVPRVSPRWLIVIGTGLTFLAFQWFARLGGSPIEYYAAWCVYMLGNFLNPWLVTFLPYTRALEISGYVLLLAWPVAIFVLRDKPEDVGQTPDGLPEDPTAEPPIPLQPFAALMQQRAFWLLLLGSAA